MNNLLALFELIGVFARRRYQAAEQHFAAIGLNHTEARLLTLLHQEGGAASQDALSGQLVIDRTNVGRAMKRLEQDGFIKRRKDEADKRANLVEMTAKGRKAVRDIVKIRDRMAREFFGDLTDSEAGKAVVLLNKALGKAES